ncbi:MAG TPA: NAD(P)-dependent oxidoreductase [Microthrixaceae bacterium]|nr:NAD(P)-dependent oxidoreductase [Microthrixaceae bacterium]
MSAGAEPVGFIGLGNIGAPMATRLLDWPGGLVVHDVRAEATEPFVAEGATAAASPAELASRASVVCIVVQDEDQVRGVLEGPDGILAGASPGTVVAVHSTISAEGAEALGELASGAGVELLDAPVSGGAAGAHSGTLAVMLGGSEAAVQRATPVLERFATMVQHMGPVGAGTRTKITRNLLTFASFAVAGEAQRLAEAAGLDLGKLGEVVRHSDKVTGGPGAIMIRPTATPMAEDDGLRPIFAHSAELGAKDLELARRMAAELGVAAPFAELAQRWLPSALGLVEPPEGGDAP